ncbi:phosphotransferase family protein [Microlunatus soli]|uniref:Predicted kinase, aminoglycoside phosphotransferase (APT) family n=1 Tax=Microlunatus soli TaxID=630515 RepID=A0A1H1ZMI0_9ACTN|nr:aminoglycoside phosphotransferase family protein [Microlunatus soli]SDT35015.1 Predicted kinase, aminoglycoside phosphotransferase (APT) family [Microlunatus soli]
MTDSAFLQSLHAQFATPPDRIAGLVHKIIGGEVTSMHRVVNGYDNEVHRVTVDGHAPLFVRIRRNGEGDFSAEAAAMESARGAGVPTPEIVALDRVASDDAERDVMILAAAPGRALEEVADDLSVQDHHAALVDLGRVLARLHEVRMPGAWRPGPDGRWPDPAELRGYFIRDRLAERPELVRAGLSEAEIERTFEALQEDPAPHTEPVLCHGDLNRGHVFVDSRSRVSCLIDWGMWHAGSTAGEFGYVWKTFGDDGLEAVLLGHRAGSPTDPELRRSIAVSLCQTQIGHIAHHVGIGDDQGVRFNVARLRRALAELDRPGRTP